MISLEKAISKSREISYWLKNTESVFLDVKGQLLKYAFGVKSISKLIGKTDFNFPSVSEKLAIEFQNNDKKVMSLSKSCRFFETYLTPTNDWGAVLTIKTPYILNNKVIGTLGYCVSLPQSIFRLKYLLGKNLDPSLMQTSYSLESSHQILTKKEMEVLFFVIRGKTSKEIANFLNISYRTVEQHVEAIRKKFNCRNKSELIALTMENDYFNVIPDSLIAADFSVLL